MSERHVLRWTERSLSPLFQPAAILPAQIESGGAAAFLPEIRLMVAILEDAINCVRNYRDAERGPRRRLFREAEQWFMSHNTAWPFAFERICEALDLDAGHVRRCLQLPTQLGY